jgi:hypothetical protein
MIKIAGVKSADKINFKEFVDFFYKIDWFIKWKYTALLQLNNGWFIKYYLFLKIT